MLAETSALSSSDPILATPPPPPYVEPSDSLASVSMARVLSGISGLTASPTTVDLYTTRDFTNKNFVRNASLWLQGVTNLSCIPVFSTGVGTSFNGVLVTPDILIQANHAHAGGTMYFVSDTNRVYSRDVIGGVNIAGTDLFVTRLSSPLPSDIVPAKVLPKSSYNGAAVNFTAGTFSGGYLPAVFTNQFATLQIGTVSFLPPASILEPSGAPLLEWYKSVISGDSGSPVFLVIDNELVALATWYTSNMTSFSEGPLISENVSDVNAAIAALGSTTSLTVKDLSAYPTY